MALAANVTPLTYLVYIIGGGLGITLVVLALSISAAILKLACRTAGAEVPDTGRAMFVSFLETIVGGMVYYLSIVSVAFFSFIAQLDRPALAAMLGLSAVGVSFVVPAGLYVPMLRVTFRKGLVISLFRYVITLSILAVLVCGILLLTKAKGR
jgi:hypothetical protein